MQIVYAINADLLRTARRRENMDDRAAASVSLIDENGERRVRMAYVAVLASRREPPEVAQLVGMHGGATPAEMAIPLISFQG